MSLIRSDRASDFSPAPAFDFIIVPVALVGSVACAATPLLSILVWLCSMAVHEVGHAIGFILSSRIAVPTFGFTVPLQSEPSIYTFGGLLLLGGGWHWGAWRSGYYLLGSIPIALAPLLLLFSWVVPRQWADEFAILAGQGGELVLGAFLLIIFFQPMPQLFRWRVNRYLFLVIGAGALSSALHRWLQASRDASQLPLGAFIDFNRIFGEGSESSGDMDRLIREFGWTADELVSLFMWMSLGTVVVLLGVYLSMLYRHVSQLTRFRESQ